MKFLIVICCAIFVVSGLPSEYLIESQMAARKSAVKCEYLDRWNFLEEGKIWRDSCQHCHVCGAEEIRGHLMESEKWCISQTGGPEICRGGCGCPDGYFRHNVTRKRDNTKVIVEICVSTEECSRIISDVRCPRGQHWDMRAPICTRTCENSVAGGDKTQPCPKIWGARCVCPSERPIWHKNKCIKLSDCPK